MKLLIFQSLSSCFLTIFLGVIMIPLLKRLKAGQPILKYVESHKDKSGTPTMGGLFFVISSVLVFFVFNGIKINSGLVAVIISVAYMIVGFLDDYIKIRLKQNEGLKAYQKIIFQLAIALISGIYAYRNGLTQLNIPFTKLSVDFGVWTIPLVVFVFLAITNSVNLTDGLDGLASSVSLVYLIFISILIYFQGNANFNGEILSLSLCFIGGILAFLLFNVNKAKVFMGDTGSLALGGLVGSISIFTNNTLIIPILGIAFVISSLSVIIQVLHYKRTKKRVFLMAPYHHHLQLKGITEVKIGYIYSFVTVIMGTLLIICYL